mgnify:CR=1 FL=1
MKTILAAALALSMFATEAAADDVAAPIVIVILGSMGMSGTFPKAIISMYLCFFPVAVAMVKGLRSPGILELELLHTYAASASHTFWKLRVPASLPFLFPSRPVWSARSWVNYRPARRPVSARGC